MKIIKIVLTMVLTTGLLVGMLPARSLAAGGTIYLSPASASVQVGSSVTVALRINPGTLVDSVQATVGYNQSALQFVSASLGAFPVCTQNSGGGGSVSLACAQLGGGTSSDSLIASITFTALVGSGSTPLTISNAEAASNGTYTNPSSSSGTISLTSPAVATPTPTPTAPAPTTRVTRSTSVAPAAPATPAAAPAPTIPAATITAVTVQPQFSRATVRVTTNIATNATIIYGPAKTALTNSLSLTSIGLQATGTLSTGLVPGTTYYYQVIVKNASGVATNGDIKSFTTVGYTIVVTVLDSSDHPLAHTTVTLHSTPMTTQTDGQGVARFTNVPPGEHQLIYTVAGHTYSQPVYVADNAETKAAGQTAAPQTAAVILAGYSHPAGTSAKLRWLLGLLAVALIGVGFNKRRSIWPWLMKMWPHRRQPSDLVL